LVPFDRTHISFPIGFLLQQSLSCNLVPYIVSYFPQSRGQVASENQRQDNGYVLPCLNDQLTPIGTFRYPSTESFVTGHSIRCIVYERSRSLKNKNQRSKGWRKCLVLHLSTSRCRRQKGYSQGAARRLPVHARNLLCSARSRRRGSAKDFHSQPLSTHTVAYQSPRHRGRSVCLACAAVENEQQMLRCAQTKQLRTVCNQLTRRL